ncbi:hypothetical protein L829_1061 [Mycobacteroides abscessus MAB_030201_1075]|uniref:Uncharacterized protein n=1 Tax=Mycobacteroides abscessus MAB_030201_1075 TaxID=1335410 RepID=A0A829PED0_9MYCO|nr:hypothetical protein L835_3079 [Mycobacteroides abscessus MAB_110811_1470]ETZ87514.1 hypothetical protein L829_1061 [Mycobacteroides abscessus MAB_030201_1075]ETZ92313.1 hypothetical protein L828_3143 [Mycobacteroides abscessus MAB_030201_1061]
MHALEVMRTPHMCNVGDDVIDRLERLTKASKLLVTAFGHP